MTHYRERRLGYALGGGGLAVIAAVLAWRCRSWILWGLALFYGLMIALWVVMVIAVAPFYAFVWGFHDHSAWPVLLGALAWVVILSVAIPGYAVARDWWARNGIAVVNRVAAAWGAPAVPKADPGRKRRCVRHGAFQFTRGRWECSSCVYLFTLTGPVVCVEEAPAKSTTTGYDFRMKCALVGCSALLVLLLLGVHHYG